MKSTKTAQIIRNACLFFLFVNICYVFSGAIHNPLRFVDAWTIWLYKAKILYLEGWSLEFLKYPANDLMHAHYPLLLPLFYSLLYAGLGGVYEVVPAICSVIVYVMSLLFCYKVLKMVTKNSVQVTMGTFVYSCLPPFMSQGGRYEPAMADIYLTFFYWVGLSLWLRAFKSKVISRKELVLLIACTAIASMIKLEGIFLIVFFFFLPISIIQKIVATLCASVSTVGWVLTRHLVKIPSSYGLRFPSFSEFIDRGIVIITDTLVSLFHPFLIWHIFWWTFLFAGIAVFRTDALQSKLLVLFLLLCCGFFFVYLTSTVPIEIYVGSSLHRLLLQISPIWFFLYYLWISQIFSKVFPKLPHTKL